MSASTHVRSWDLGQKSSQAFVAGAALLSQNSSWETLRRFARLANVVYRQRSNSNNRSTASLWVSAVYASKRGWTVVPQTCHDTNTMKKCLISDHHPWCLLPMPSPSNELQSRTQMWKLASWLTSNRCTEWRRIIQANRNPRQITLSHTINGEALGPTIRNPLHPNKRKAHHAGRFSSKNIEWMVNHAPYYTQ